MLNSYLQLCEAIMEKDLNKFIHLIETLEITDLNAFDSVLLRLASFHSFEITQHLLEKKVTAINEKWFDRLILNDLSLDITQIFWNLGVRGESALVSALSNNTNNGEVLQFLIKEQAPIKPSDEDEFLKHITQKKYTSLFKNYVFSDELKNKLEQKFNNFPFKINQSILKKMNEDVHFFDNLDNTVLQNLSAKQLEKLIHSLEDNSYLKKAIEQLSLNQIATLDKSLCDIIFQKITKKFDYLPKQLSSMFFLNQNMEYFLDNIEYNLDFSLFCYKKLIFGEDLKKPKIKNYLNKIIKLDDIDYFIEQDPRLEVDYLNFSKNQRQVLALINNDLEKLKSLDCTHPSLFLKALSSKKSTKEIIKYLASKVEITEKVILEGYKNIDVILEFVKRSTPINLLNIYDENIFQKAIKLIESPEKYINLDIYKSSSKIESYKTQFILNLYLEDKIQSKVALYNVLKTDKLNEQAIIKLIEKDLKNNLEIHSWNYHHNIYGLKYLSNLNKENKDKNTRLLYRHFSGMEFSKEEIRALMQNNESYAFKLNTISLALNNNYPDLLDDIPIDDIKKTIAYLNPNVKLETFLYILKTDESVNSLVAEGIITNNQTLIDAILIQKEKLFLEKITPSNQRQMNNLKSKL
jgi:hypothetical protein